EHYLTTKNALTPNVLFCHDLYVCISGNLSLFFFNEPATPEIYTLSLHDALPISYLTLTVDSEKEAERVYALLSEGGQIFMKMERSEEHTSELQSRSDLVCRLLLEKKKQLQIDRVVGFMIEQFHRQYRPCAANAPP